ncbi:MAG: VOC family protein, partial [Deltaproteobacteria bacterium]|nr:VOC family protein [Deltaproteobacteria bacterium]
MNGISHVAIGVRNMERSLKFYRDLLGLEVRYDQMQPIGGMASLYANPPKGQRHAAHSHYGKGA